MIQKFLQVFINFNFCSFQWRNIIIQKLKPMSCVNFRKRSLQLGHLCCVIVTVAAYNKPECAQESSRVFMLIANKKRKRKKKREVACLDVPTSQCCSGESIDTTLFGQYDRQTGLSRRTFYFVHFWSLEDTSRVQKHTKMEKAGRNSLIILKFVNFRFKA